jgi:hypothetical protein
MIAEHVFVTTLEPPVALTRIMDFLTARGFRPREHTSAAQGPWSSVVFFRGRKYAARAKSVSELPQEVRLGWDRGRVTVAVSIRAVARSILPVTASMDGAPELPASSPKARLHTNLILSIAEGLELLLSREVAPAEAAARWEAVEEEIRLDARSRRRKSLVYLFILLALLALLVALLVYVLGR